MTKDLELIKRDVLEKHDTGSVKISRQMLTWISSEHAAWIQENLEILAVSNPDYEFSVEESVFDGSVTIRWKKVSYSGNKLSVEAKTE